MSFQSQFKSPQEGGVGVQGMNGFPYSPASGLAQSDVKTQPFELMKRQAQQNNATPTYDLSKLRDSHFNTQHKDQMSNFERTGQSWNQSDLSQQQGILRQSVSSDKARNSRTFKFRDFNQKQQQNQLFNQSDKQQQQYQTQQQSQYQQYQQYHTQNEWNTNNNNEYMNNNSGKVSLHQFRTQQDFNREKKIQFSPNINQTQNAYYQYINPVTLQKEVLPQPSQNMSQNKQTINRKSLLSQSSQNYEKTSQSLVQINNNGSSKKKQDFNTPNAKSGTANSQKGQNNNNNGSGSVGNNRYNISTPSSITNIPLGNTLNSHLNTERYNILQQQDKDNILNKFNSTNKRNSFQETQNFYYQYNKQIPINSLTQIPQQINQPNSLLARSESKILSAQQQIVKLTQKSNYINSIQKETINSSNQNQNSTNLSQSVISPSVGDSTPSHHKIPKNINLSKTFSSPFLKKVNQLKKQQALEIANHAGKSPQNSTQFTSKTLTAFPSSFQNTQYSSNSQNFNQLSLKLQSAQKQRERSSSSDSNSCKSLFDSPLSPPPKTKLMMEMSKYKKEQKEQTASIKQARKTLTKQSSDIHNNFFRMKKIDSSESNFYENKLGQQQNNSTTQFKHLSFSPQKVTSIATQSQKLIQQQPTSQFNNNNSDQLSKHSLEEDQNNDEQYQGYDDQYNQQQQEQQIQQQNKQQFELQQNLDNLLKENPNEKNYKQLQKLYHSSYKKIENILEENKYFQSSNKIEEDMLSVTMQNKAILPRKLGILSLKTSTESPNAVHSARVLKGTLNQIFEDEQDEQQGSIQNLSLKKSQFPLSLTNLARDTFSSNNNSSSINNNNNKSNLPTNRSFKIKGNEENMQIPLSGASYLNFETTKGEKPKQKLNLAYQNIGSNYAEMISKALNHHDMSSLHTINLSSNNLSGKAVLTISRNLPDSIQSIDLSNNSIGAEGTRSLIPLFDSKKYFSLRKINLEHNNITDNGLKVIIPSIFSNMSIYVLNISHNKLSDQSCAFIKKLLLNSSYLQELYLHWNKISSKGGILIAQGLSENLNIKVLDLSHNGLGAIPKLKCGEKIIKACSVLESGVKHLDISYNQFTKQECQEIGIALQSNVSLYGVHIEGNESQALIDQRGFVFFPEKQNFTFENNHINDIQIVTQRINSVRTKGPLKLQSFDCKALDNCWICHGWTEIRFEMKESSSDVFTGEPVFLHLDFEDYQPIYMDKDPEDPTRFVLNRMCPPNRKITFFFSDPCKNVIYTSKDYKFQDFTIPEGVNLQFYDIVHHHHDKEETPKANANNSDPKLDNNKKQDNKNNKSNKGNNTNNNNKQKQTTTPTANTSKNNKQKQELTIKVGNKVKIDEQEQEQLKSAKEQKKEEEEEALEEALDEVSKTIKKKFKVKYLDGTVIEYHAPTYVNYIETEIQRDIICKPKDYEPVVKAKPRQPETYFRITKTDLWHRGISLFRDFIPDSDALDKRCFEFDWSTSKLPKILEKGKDIEDCKKILQSVYSLLRIAYKYLSCTGIANDVFCITQNPFSNFAQKSQIIDNNLLMIRDIDFNFISASNIALKAKTYRNPDKALIRNEFLEVMGRIALDKYIRNEKAKLNSEAMKLFFYEEGLLNHLYEYDSPQEWRRIRYWNQECDEKLKAYLPFLKTLYNLYADSRKNEKRYFTTIKSMSLQEFKDMVYKFDVLDELLVERDITISFNLSMMTQVDELNSDRHFQMTFVEFIEALSRLAEKKSMVPLGELVEEYEVQERIVIQLSFKIESMLALMKKKHELMSLKENQQGSNQNTQNQVLLPQQVQQQLQTQNSLANVVQLLKRKSGLQTNVAPSNLKSSKNPENSINFIKQLTMKKAAITQDDKKEQDKLNLKGIISKIMNKEVQKIKSNINSPSKTPGKSPRKQLALELAEMNKNQN